MSARNPFARLTLEMIVEADLAGFSISEVEQAIATLSENNPQPVTVNQAIHAIAFRGATATPIEDVRIRHRRWDRKVSTSAMIRQIKKSIEGRP